MKMNLDEHECVWLKIMMVLLVEYSFDKLYLSLSFGLEFAFIEIKIKFIYVNM